MTGMLCVCLNYVFTCLLLTYVLNAELTAPSCCYKYINNLSEASLSKIHLTLIDIHWSVARPSYRI